MNHLEKCLICALVGGVLFFVLSPGVLLTLPPTCRGKVFVALKDQEKDSGACATSYSAVAVHSVVFGLVMFLICFFMCASTNNAGTKV